MTQTASPVVHIAGRLELFVDDLLFDHSDAVQRRLHTPTPAPGRLNGGHYMTVLFDPQLNRFRAYCRQYDPTYTQEKFDGNDGELTCLSESTDAITWTEPDVGQFEINGSRHNNVVLRHTPSSHNFSPFIDTNPAAPASARYKALAGVHSRSKAPGTGLHGFESPDGVHWKMIGNKALIDTVDFAFDSQHPCFWSAAEGCYVCFFRSWQSSQGRLRTISRTTSTDFIHWTEPVCMDPNLPGEQLYTSQVTSYFRAPHYYLSLPTRFLPQRGSSTDILFMSARAGATRFDRLFTHGFIRPGLDPARWGNRSNYAATGVIGADPSGQEISLFHGPAGRRFTLRTDGFVSLHADAATVSQTSRPFTFEGQTLWLNVSTSAAGAVRAELQDPAGHALPGFALADCDPIVDDKIRRKVTWKGKPSLAALAGRPVRLKLELCEADIYSFQFGADA